jgi:Uma2 family endonuclease
MATTATKLHTVEEWMDLPEAETRRTELVDGEVLPMGNARFLHEKLKAAWILMLARYLLSNPIGALYSETMYRLGPATARIPDVSVLLPDRPLVDGPCEGAPEIAIEIVSSESAPEMARKLRDYLNHGCQLVIYVYPADRGFFAHTAGNFRWYGEQDTFSTPLLSGFAMPVAELFAGI